MKVTYELTQGEIEFLEDFKRLQYTYNFSGRYDAFRDKHRAAIREFSENDLIYHSNSDHEDSYIRYSLTVKGTKFIQEHEKVETLEDRQLKIDSSFKELTELAIKKDVKRTFFLLCDDLAHGTDGRFCPTFTDDEQKTK